MTKCLILFDPSRWLTADRGLKLATAAKNQPPKKKVSE